MKRVSADAWAVGLIVVLTGVVTWRLFFFDVWLLQQDITNQFLPWYAYLGRRLSEGAIPGWNPYQSSGAPFAGDPQSGWMYFPAMLLFPLLAPITAFKSLVGLELLISGLSMFAFARVMRLGVVASLAAAFVLEYSMFSNTPAYCCTNRVQVWTWVPMMLLGVELALRARSWRTRVMPWCLAGFALSQIYAGWLGQGTVYALYLFASFLAYRVLFADAEARGALRERLVVGAATGLGAAAVSVGIAAAGLFPRYVVSRETLIGQGNYADLPKSLIPSPTLRALLLNILGSDNAPRGVAIGGVAFVLIWFAPFIARRAYGTTYFAILTVSVYVLMLHDTPLHAIFYLVPNFHAIHAHNTINVSAVGAIGPAMLVGATVERLPTWRPRGARRFLIALPSIAIAAGLLALSRHGLRNAGVVQIAALLATALLFVALFRSPRAANWAQIALVALAFIVPTGIQTGSAWAGAAIPTPWQRMESFPPQRLAAIAELSAETDPGGAGGFLQAQLTDGEVFRFSGYTTSLAPGATSVSYTANQDGPFVLAILTNARAMALGLYDVSAYNPSQIARYARFINVLNGSIQNYHMTFIIPNGFASKLFPLLNARYVLVDRRLNGSNSRVNKIIKGRHAVYSDPWVTVYESDSPTASAWIVHTVKRLPKANVLTAMQGKTFDPRTKAFVEGGRFDVKPVVPGADEHATVTSYAPERIVIQATAASAGLLVVSEVYESGWNAYVDGKPAVIRPTDYAFRGIALSAGSHTVEFRYEPPSLKIGIWVSVLTGVIVAALVGWRLSSWARERSSNSRT